MITAAPWQSWPGFEAFFISADRGPCYLIQVDRAELSRRLRAGETLSQIVGGAP